jgi:hypothetical protein
LQVVIESKRVPYHVQQRVRRAGGENLYGQPMYRVVWGWDRQAWLCGAFEEHDKDQAGVFSYIRTVYENRLIPKYGNFYERWLLEKWMPPEFYGSPQAWRETHTVFEGGRDWLELGPYPAQGDYELSFPIQAPDGGFLDLTPGVVEHLVKAIEYSRRLVDQNRYAAAAALRNRHTLADKRWDSKADAVLDDAFDAFHGQPFVVNPGVPTPAANPTP